MNHQELAAAISRAHGSAKKYGGNIVPSNELDRADRELLVRTNWLQEIIRGWYMLTRPDIQLGDTSAWYANFWDFVQIYLQQRYGSSYCLSAEHSIDLHVGNPTLPKQLIVIIEKGGGTSVSLPFNTSILVYSDPKNFPPERTMIRGIQVMSLAFALCKATPTYFHKNQIDAELALNLVKDPQEFVYIITTYNFIRPGERIIGGYHALNQIQKAELISEQLKKNGMNLKPINPFEISLIPEIPIRSPHQGRIISLWALFRPVVIKHFPQPPGIPPNPSSYLEEIEELYVKDAYNSLSIEGYRVDPELIERVHNNHWDPDHNPLDKEEKNALAARGYYEAFVEVKKAIFKILEDKSPGKIIEKELQNWFQKLFSCSVNAGILKANELMGYRKTQVYIRNSRHVPLPKEALFNAMEGFFECLKQETHPAARAILGHFFFVYIHPFMDGNGRLGRFIMNAMLASGGYPWTIIQVKNRSQYFAALEKASVDHNIEPFTIFVSQEMANNLP